MAGFGYPVVPQGKARIRVIVPATNDAWVEWESARPAAAGPVTLALAAFSGGTRGEASLFVGGAPVLRFPLGARESFDVSGGGWHPLSNGYPISGPSTRVRHSRGAATFLAAEGQPAFQFLSASS